MNMIQAGSKDTFTIHKIICATVNAIYSKYYPTDVVQFFLDYHSSDNIKKAIDQEYVLLVKKDDQFIGTGSLAGNEIKRMFILPEFQDMGCGSLLLNRLEQKAAEDGYASVELDSSLPAYGLYERRGYLPVKNERIETQNGQVLFYHRMSKRVDTRNKTRIVPHYYSDRLKKKLEGFCFARTAIVEAPSGYGKTTAVRDFFEAGPLRSVPVYWFTAADETPAAGFRRLCLEIDKIDNRAGKRLLRVKLPNAATIGEICVALRSIQCKHQAYLVVDNFQFLQIALPPSFLAALLEQGGEGLHIVIITQTLKRHLLDAIAGHDFLHITAADLRLNARDIQRYYSQAGLSLTTEEARSLERYTEGWIVAVNLQLRAFIETGTFSDQPGILVLMEHLVWDKLTEAQQTLLLRLSPFESVTMQQICNLNGRDELPEYALDALNSPFIHWEPTGRRYELHSILTNLLKAKRGERGAAFERECLLGAGDLYRNEGDMVKALDFYVRAGDYEKMLSLDLSGLTLEKIGTISFAELARDIALSCPAEIKKRHPLSMLQIAWALLMAGMNPEFDALMEELRLMLKTDGREETSHLLGEWTLLSSFKSFPRLEEMTSILRQTVALFKGNCSRVILPTVPWWFGNYSPFAEFHTQPGQADREADALEEYITLYSRLTSGHGSGADALFRAELAYHRGELNDAEILAYKAVYFAESNQQSIILLGATLQLAEIALHKADTAGWRQAIGSMERSASFSAQDTFVVQSTIDIVRGVLLNELQNQTNVADWLKNGKFSGERLLPRMTINALFAHLSYLMHQGEYARLVGTARAVYPEGLSTQPFRELLLSLTVAVGEMALGNRDEATALVKRAATAALPDGLLFPFASYTWLLQGLTGDLIAEEYPALISKFNDIKKRFLSGWTILHQVMILDELPSVLSPREYEVAKLAAEGLHNGEIAARLTVTENTVRAHLRVIFQKLDIDRRARLSEKLK